MRRATIGAALGALLLGLAAPAAHAGDDSRYEGDCAFNSVAQETVTDGHYVGYGYAALVVYSRTHGNVVTAAVTCDLRVNGVSQWTRSGSGAGVVAFADRMDFFATDYDTVTMCTTVDYTSDSTPTTTDCGALDHTQVPPEVMYDLLSVLLDGVNGTEAAYVDPVVCPAFQALAPGAAPVDVRPDGDVYLDGELYWDCPPYATPPPPPLALPTGPPAPAPFVPTGGGWNDGDTGLLALTGGQEVAAGCAFRVDRATGLVVLAGAAAAVPGAGVPDEVTIRCTLQDATTGTPFADVTRTGSPVAVLDAEVPTNAAAVTVCTEGTARWGSRTVTTGRYCRPGRPV